MFEKKISNIKKGSASLTLSFILSLLTFAVIPYVWVNLLIFVVSAIGIYGRLGKLKEVIVFDNKRNIMFYEVFWGEKKIIKIVIEKEECLKISRMISGLTFQKFLFLKNGQKIKLGGFTKIKGFEEKLEEFVPRFKK